MALPRSPLIELRREDRVERIEVPLANSYRLEAENFSARDPRRGQTAARTRRRARSGAGDRGALPRRGHGAAGDARRHLAGLAADRPRRGRLRYASSRAPGPGRTWSAPPGASAPGGSSPSTWPPKPPPTIRAPQSARVASAGRRPPRPPGSRPRSSRAGSRARRRAAAPSSSRSPRSSASTARSHALVLGDHVPRSPASGGGSRSAISSVASRRLSTPSSPHARAHSARRWL